MAVQSTITSATDEANIFRGNVSFVSGTWDQDGHVTAFAITTGGTDVLVAGVYNATTTAMTPAFAMNKDATALPSNGSLQIKGPNVDATGTWWAIVRTSGTN